MMNLIQDVEFICKCHVKQFPPMEIRHFTRTLK